MEQKKFQKREENVYRKMLSTKKRRKKNFQLKLRLAIVFLFSRFSFFFFFSLPFSSSFPFISLLQFLLYSKRSKSQYVKTTNFKNLKASQRLRKPFPYFFIPRTKYSLDPQSAQYSSPLYLLTSPIELRLRFP